MEFNKDESVSMKPIILKNDKRDLLQSSLIMFYTGRERESTAIHKEQMQNIEEKLDIYNQMRDIAYKTHEALVKCDIQELGLLMDANWKLKKQLAGGISDSTIDSYYEKAMKAGALGGKLMGAGGGGFLLFVAPEEKHKDIANALSLRQEPFRLDPLGSRIMSMEDL